MVGYALGGQIDRIQLGGQADENLPERFGDCQISWGRVAVDCEWQLERELLTILAGPVAEMIYRGEKLHPAHFGPWKLDWQQAWVRCGHIVDHQKRTVFLESLIQELHVKLSDDNNWASIAAVADELLAHEYLEQGQLNDALQFWVG